MKNLYLLGLPLWFLASFFGFQLFNSLLLIVDEMSIIWKIVIVFVTVMISILGLYKILLSFILFNSNIGSKFNLIASIYSIIGILGLIAGYLKFGLTFTIQSKSMFGSAMSLAFAIILGWILINGFVLFPKSIRK